MSATEGSYEFQMRSERIENGFEELYFVLAAKKEEEKEFVRQKLMENSRDFLSEYIQEDEELNSDFTQEEYE